MLTFVTFFPLLGALAILVLINGKDADKARLWALGVSLVTFGASLLLYAGFDAANPGFQYMEEAPWLPSLGIHYRMGIDGISLPFIILNALLTPLCILASWESVQKRVKEYMIAFLALEAFVNGVFCALDFVLFYVLWEAMLIPMFLIIGVWGGNNRVYAALKFFLYTLAGSVLMLIAMLALYFKTGTFSIPELMLAPLDFKFQLMIFLAFFVAFAVKVPMWPVHTWLPDAHVQAPTAGSVILAGILLKMGAYGFLRFSLPILPDATQYFTPMVYALSLVAIVYTALVALMQEDLKKLIAYSSVSHMGFVTIGIFALNQNGVEGGILQMINHGIVSGALFLIVGVVYDRLHTREIARFGGLALRMPVYAVIFMLFTMASVGLPGTNGFVGEFLILLGAFLDNTWVAFIAATGLVLGAAYMLWMYKRVVFGEIVHEDVKALTDVTRREVLVFAPLIVITLWMGFYPGPVLDVMSASVTNLIEQAHVVKSGVATAAAMAH
ncbi:NADH-quinone oxidoreductase subunit M [Magnetofaba australis]|uniref:Putative proton-translocating NADH-quinone oxidoreductase subunit M n=1 Tax=Magnetofaba australis IT-1 TaxID=1434232 RepID=A0A1Y2K7M5_9PROT|nr:NADH-quinone oxidoreductase subunit M [Magnetofaba australis]OSM06228.1 putative proton-translocating NADH-quinone oxidoreductase subunit M [Magnetofaba australis IT-1]